VPTVVGYAGATQDLPEGAIVLVDGDSGRVTIQDRAGADGAPESAPSDGDNEAEAKDTAS
jgi:phosphoenolpyruvate-protein kinase (PTS system EI component)